ncbi:hypothetical protein MPSEU_000436400 [Mayamaea pseudoterrestris]|nr:hypothetical protein MPSEU_000436400 [Mayamaea pseudoterrestris]
MFSKKQRSKSGSTATCSSSNLSTQPQRPRGFSLPADWGRRRRIKGIMKYLTHDESVHSNYGSERGGDLEEPEKARIEVAVTPIDKAVDRRKIQFANIQIREYNRTIGDNPSCSSGPPISISWEYDPNTKVVSVDQYEDNRPPRRRHFEMCLPRSVRQEMLRKDWDVTQTQIANAVRNNIKVKNQRRVTVSNLGKAAKFEEILERTQRSLKRGLFFQKSTTQQAEDLRRRAEDMERLRAEVYGAGDEGKDEEEYGTEENPIDNATEVGEDDDDTVCHSVSETILEETAERDNSSFLERKLQDLAKESQSPPRNVTCSNDLPMGEPHGPQKALPAGLLFM